MTIFPSFCHSSLRNRSSSSDLCRHYLSACSPRFFQNTFKGRSSRSHRSAISFSLSLVQFWTSSGAPQGHPSLTFAVYSSNPPSSPFRSMTAVRCGRGCRLVVSLKHAGVQLLRRCQVSIRAIRSRPSPAPAYAPANLGNPLSSGIWPRFGNCYTTVMHELCIVAR